MHRLLRPLTRFRADQRGITSLYFTLSAAIMFMTLLAGIDLLRVHMVRARALSALDAAVLAAGHSLDQDDYQTQTTAYFNINMPSDYLGATIGSPAYTVGTASSSGQTISATLTGSVPLLSFGFIGLSAINFTVGNTATRVVAGSNLELVMVMDNTGSMEGSKMTAMKSAATTLVTTLMGTGSTGDSLYIGLVPFAETVRAGKDINGDVRSRWISALSPYASTSAWTGCLMERAVDSDYPIDIRTPATQTFATYGPTRCYQTTTTTKNSSSGHGWGPGGGTTTTTSYSCAIEAASDSNNYYDGCVSSKVAFLTSDQSTLTTAISNMQASGSTMVHSGLIWGLRMLSSDWAGSAGWGSDTLPQEANTYLSKTIVLLTDGANNPATGQCPSTNSKGGSGSSSSSTCYQGFFSAYPTDTVPSVNSSTHTVSPHGNINSSTVSNAMLAETCALAKSEGIRVFTVAFGTEINDSEILAVMQNCAVNGGKYYAPASTSELQEAFTSIGSSLSELRLTK